jgi:hypothetical protein
MKSQLSQAKNNVVRLSVALTSAIVLSGLFSPQSIANDVQVAPANCVAPYLDQAFPMRWHENYLMNPTSNIATWVICPMDLDVDVLPVGFVAFVTGGIMSGASGELPSCFFTVNSAVNLLQPPFIPGPAAIYTLSMQVDTLDTYPIWTAGIGVNALDVYAFLLDPEFWSASIFCKLPPGYGISQLVISDNF